MWRVFGLHFAFLCDVPVCVCVCVSAVMLVMYLLNFVTYFMHAVWTHALCSLLTLHSTLTRIRQILVRYFGHKNNIRFVHQCVALFNLCTAQFYNHIYLCHATRYRDSPVCCADVVWHTKNGHRMNPDEWNYKVLENLTISSSRLFIYLFNFLRTVSYVVALPLLIFVAFAWLGRGSCAL